MSNFLLKDPHCVLIHIPKTGGSSIRHGIWEKRYDGPEFWRLPSAWNDYFKFAFIRHPLDRFVSAWADFTQLRNFRGTMDEFVEIVIDDSILFDERRSTAAEKIRHHTIQQTHPFSCLQLADFVGRYENYLDDLAVVLKKVGMEAPHIPELRKTGHADWRTLLNGKQLEKLIRFYESDFKALHYETPAI